MNPIIAILKEHNVSEQQTHELFQSFTENPFMAMTLVQQLGIAPEKLQQLMGLVMTQPHLIKEAIEELGLDFSKLEEAKEKLKSQQQ